MVPPTVSTEQPKQVVEEVVETPQEVIATDTVAVQPIQQEVVSEQPKEVVEEVTTTSVVTMLRGIHDHIKVQA